MREAFELETAPCNSFNDFPIRLVSEDWLKDYEKTGKGWLQILSGSMSPLIEKGDRILVGRTALSAIHVGDIITYQDQNVLVTHRVVRKETRKGTLFFIGRGDCYSGRSRVDSKAVIGKVRQIEKDGRRINLESTIWRLFNKIICAFFYVACFTSSAGNRLAFAPGSKFVVHKIYQTGGYLLRKQIEIMANHYKRD